MSALLFEQAISEFKRAHRRHGYPTDFRVFAHALGIRIVQSNRNDSLDGDPPVIFLNCFEYTRARNSFNGMHEIAHLVLKWSGIEAALIDWHGRDLDVALPRLERWVNFGAGLFLMPDAMLNYVLSRHLDSAESIYHLHALARCSMGAAMRRIVYRDELNSVAAFVAQGQRVLDHARQNCYTPFWRGREVPEEFPTRLRPGERATFFIGEDLTVSAYRVPNGRRVVGLSLG